MLLIVCSIQDCLTSTDGEADQISACISITGTRNNYFEDKLIRIIDLVYENSILLA